MAHQRPTHEVFRQKVSNASYDKFVPASSLPTQQHVSTESRESPSVDLLEQFRRDDQAYLQAVAQEQRHDAVEELERERLEAERFRRERVAVKRRVNVADAVRGRYEQPLIGKLRLASLAKKRRVGTNKAAIKGHSTNHATNKMEKLVKGKECHHAKSLAEDGAPNVRARGVPLVSGYSSSSDEGDDAPREDSEKRGATAHGGEADG